MHVLTELKKRKNKGLTQMDTYPWCTRLAARIYDLREKQYNIATIMEEGRPGVRYARYVLLEDK